MRKIKKTALFSLIGIVALTLLFLFFPTWTPKIEGTHSINVLEQVKINGEQQQIMIRGKNVNNPVIIYVHGGPGASEIAYAKIDQSAHYHYEEKQRFFEWMTDNFMY